MNDTPEEKAAFNMRAKASMRAFLQSKTWKEKVDSIARMNAAGRKARAARHKALTEEAD